MWSSPRPSAPQALEPLRIEAFDTSVQGRRVSIVGGPEAWLGFVCALEAEQIYRGRSVLVVQEAAGGSARGAGGVLPSVLARHHWDLIVRVKEGFEAQILATYVANAPKPVRIVWCCVGGGLGEIPRALWSRWTQGVTLMGCHQEGFLGGCEWECIFFPVAHDRDKIERVLQARGGAAATAQFSRIREGISEITTSGAALVWSSIEEPDARAGALYWYDPKDYTANLSWSAVDVQDTLRTIAEWVGRRI